MSKYNYIHKVIDATSIADNEIEKEILIMKKWEEATIEAMEITETAFGPYNNNIPDSDKTQITKPDGSTGWVQEFGNGIASN